MNLLNSIQRIEPGQRRLFAFLAIIAGIFLLAWISWGQPLDANHPELGWMSFETEHFVVHYHDGARRTATVIAKIAEEIHPKLTKLYGYEPDTKFHFIVKDTDDYANGGAYYYNNKMLIWATALDYDLRGTHNWLRDVITHEYTHIIQLGAARKLPRNIPALYVQVLGYEDEKRPDVLYGFPNVLASYPVAMTVMPNWFAEGTAQYNSPELHYDWWDTHRDMQLRLRTLNDKLLPLNEIDVFGKNSLGNESVYNHGFSLVKYISETYGEDKLGEITRGQKKLFRADISESIEDAIGLTGQELYDQWAADLKDKYNRWTVNIRANECTGDLLTDDGDANLYSRFSPDGEWIYYISNRENDYFSQRNLWRIPADSAADPEMVIKMADSPFSFTPDGNAIVYSKIVRQGNESYYADLYAFDLKAKKEIRLTKFARATDPAVSPDGQKVLFVVNHDGTKDLAMLPMPSHEDWKGFEPLTAATLKKLTDFNDGSRAYRPSFSPDGNSILFAKSTSAGRDIMMMNADGSGLHTLIGGKGDQRNPSWADDGSALLYSDDHTGIYNLYRYEFTDSSSTPLTNVLGGAFMPDQSPNGGSIVYSEWTIDGYALKMLNDPQPIPESYLDYGRDYMADIPEPTFDDSIVDTIASKPYKPIFEQLFFVPRLTMDYETFKPGVYIYSSDFLEKLNLFSGFNINSRGEYDAVALFDFKVLRPTLFAEGYWIRRIDDNRFEDTYLIVGEKENDEGEMVPVYGTYGVNYSFRLLEFDLGAKMRINTVTEFEFRTAISRYDASLEYEDNSSFHYTYFKGKYYQGRVDVNTMAPQIHGNVHPRSGARAQLTAAYEDNLFIEGFEINSTALTLQEVFSSYKYWRVEGDVTRWYNVAGDLVLQPRVRVGYLDHQVDPFMHLYIGGLYGMRGYSFYSLGGTRTAIGSVALRHPIWEPSRPKLGWLHLDGLFLGVFADVGDAWREREFDADQLKSDIGAELRMKLFSWNGYPTAVTFSAARGLDHVTVTENGETTEYDPDWRFYLTVLFDFETIFPARGTAWRMR